MKSATTMPGVPEAATLPLRDIHLPEPVSWWPPAPGWWGLLALGCLLLVAALLIRRWRNRRYLRRLALQELQRIEQQYRQHREPVELARAISVLLRRTAISHYPRHDIAGLTDANWLAFLDRTGGNDYFRHGEGRVLVSAPYQNTARHNVTLDAEALLRQAENWIRAQSPGKAAAFTGHRDDGRPAGSEG